MKMPKENIDTSMFAPCGMNCLVCYKNWVIQRKRRQKV